MTDIDHSVRRRSLLDAAASKGVVVSEYVEPRRIDVVVDGHRLHALDWLGSPNLPMVVFLHGIRLTAHTWDLVSLGLRDRCRPLAVDLRGHGDSEWSPTRDYSVDAMALDVAGVLESVDAPVHLVGHSFGAAVAAWIGVERPDLVRRLVLVDAGPRLPRDASSPRRREAVSGPTHFASLDEAVDAAMSLNPRRERSTLRSSLLNNLRPHRDGSWSWKYDTEGVGPGAAFDLDRIGEVWERFELLRAPTLVVRGSESRLMSEDDLLALPARNERVQVASVEGAGHTVQGDNPAGLIEKLSAFLEI